MNERERALNLVSRLRNAAEMSADVTEAAALQQQAQTALLAAILDELVALRADLAKGPTDA